VIYGLLLIVVMIFYPGGVAQFYNWLSDRIKQARMKASEPTAEELA
jgi:hypothetical protein